MRFVILLEHNVQLGIETLERQRLFGIKDAFSESDWLCLKIPPINSQFPVFESLQSLKVHKGANRTKQNFRPNV